MKTDFNKKIEWHSKCKALAKEQGLKNFIISFVSEGDVVFTDAEIGNDESGEIVKRMRRYMHKVSCEMSKSFAEEELERCKNDPQYFFDNYVVIKKEENPLQ